MQEMQKVHDIHGTVNWRLARSGAYNADRELTTGKREWKKKGFHVRIVRSSRWKWDRAESRVLRIAFRRRIYLRAARVDCV